MAYLDIPKGMHKSTYDNMMDVVTVLYFYRVITLSQLSDLSGLSSHDLRRKLERFPAVTCNTYTMTLYQDNEWRKLSRVNVYTLSRDVAMEFEHRKNMSYYTEKPHKDPHPDTKTLNRFVLIADLAVQFHKMKNEEIAWVNNAMFENYVFEDHENTLTTSLPISSGFYWDESVGGKVIPHYYGVGLFMDSIGGFTSYIKRAFPAQYDHLYKGVVFVTAELMKEAITICQRHAEHVVLHNYEWSVDNIRILAYGIKRQWEVILKAYIEQYSWRNCTVTYAPEGHGDLGFRWEVRSDNQVVEYFDTTVMRTIGEIQKMATQRKAKGTVFVTTQEEKEAWTTVSKTAYARVKYQVIDWPIR